MQIVRREEECANNEVKHSVSSDMKNIYKNIHKANVSVHKDRKKKRPKKKCGHCRKRGHNKNECWILNPGLKPDSSDSEEQVNAAIQEETYAPSLSATIGAVQTLW